METTIAITLSGHDAEYRLEENAYKGLRLYLDRAAERLSDDPDRADVLRRPRAIGRRQARRLARIRATVS